MRYFILFFSLLCLPLVLKAQILKGKVYDATTNLKNIKVLSTTQNRLNLTNEKGQFDIIARVNDTLLLESLYYHPIVVELNASHFEDIAVFELKKIVSELDKVEIRAHLEQLVLNSKLFLILLEQYGAKNIN